MSEPIKEKLDKLWPDKFDDVVNDYLKDFKSSKDSIMQQYLMQPLPPINSGRITNTITQNQIMKSRAQHNYDYWCNTNLWKTRAIEDIVLDCWNEVDSADYHRQPNVSLSTPAMLRIFNHIKKLEDEIIKLSDEKL